MIVSAWRWDTIPIKNNEAQDLKHKSLLEAFISDLKHKSLLEAFISYISTYGN